ncbi:hypothetical protein B0H17DRAFT_1142792 [Mycena rosella]|uniref:Uncharacterized protein n=1 Tax=Mycena rosella TaxID=1033263 RepID=A0AAD7G8L7_MYCRO|nr:hypothetical protein B0H17DRAFT_1142792 [Mycena rosella]
MPFSSFPPPSWHSPPISRAFFAIISKPSDGFDLLLPPTRFPDAFNLRNDESTGKYLFSAISTNKDASAFFKGTGAPKDFLISSVSSLSRVWCLLSSKAAEPRVPLILGETRVLPGHIARGHEDNEQARRAKRGRVGPMCGNEAAESPLSLYFLPHSHPSFRATPRTSLRSHALLPIFSTNTLTSSPVDALYTAPLSAPGSACPRCGLVRDDFVAAAPPVASGRASSLLCRTLSFSLPYSFSPPLALCSDRYAREACGLQARLAAQRYKFHSRRRAGTRFGVRRSMISLDEGGTAERADTLGLGAALFASLLRAFSFGSSTNAIFSASAPSLRRLASECPIIQRTDGVTAIKVRAPIVLGCTSPVLAATGDTEDPTLAAVVPTLVEVRGGGEAAVWRTVGRMVVRIRPRCGLPGLRGGDQGDPRTAHVRHHFRSRWAWSAARVMCDARLRRTFRSINTRSRTAATAFSAPWPRKPPQASESFLRAQGFVCVGTLCTISTRLRPNSFSAPHLGVARSTNHKCGQHTIFDQETGHTRKPANCLVSSQTLELCLSVVFGEGMGPPRMEDEWFVCVTLENQPTMLRWPVSRSKIVPEISGWAERFCCADQHSSTPPAHSSSLNGLKPPSFVKYSTTLNPTARRPSIRLQKWRQSTRIESRVAVGSTAERQSDRLLRDTRIKGLAAVGPRADSPHSGDEHALHTPAARRPPPTARPLIEESSAYGRIRSLGPPHPQAAWLDIIVWYTYRSTQPIRSSPPPLVAASFHLGWLSQRYRSYTPLPRQLAPAEYFKARTLDVGSARPVPPFHPRAISPRTDSSFVIGEPIHDRPHGSRAFTLSAACSVWLGAGRLTRWYTTQMRSGERRAALRVEGTARCAWPRGRVFAMGEGRAEILLMRPCAVMRIILVPPLSPRPSRPARPPANWDDRAHLARPRRSATLPPSAYRPPLCSPPAHSARPPHRLIARDDAQVARASESKLEARSRTGSEAEADEYECDTHLAHIVRCVRCPLFVCGWYGARKTCGAWSRMRDVDGLADRGGRAEGGRGVERRVPLSFAAVEGSARGASTKRLRVCRMRGGAGVLVPGDSQFIAILYALNMFYMVYMLIPHTTQRDNDPVSRLNKQFVIINFLLLFWVLSASDNVPSSIRMGDPMVQTHLTMPQGYAALFISSRGVDVSRSFKACDLIACVNVALYLYRENGVFHGGPSGRTRYTIRRDEPVFDRSASRVESPPRKCSRHRSEGAWGNASQKRRQTDRWRDDDGIADFQEASAFFRQRHSGWWYDGKRRGGSTSVGPLLAIRFVG